MTPKRYYADAIKVFVTPEKRKSVIGAVFVPGVCCAHEWANRGYTRQEYCVTCGATCVRGKDGKIVQYDGDAAFKPASVLT